MVPRWFLNWNRFPPLALTPFNSHLFLNILRLRCKQQLRQGDSSLGVGEGPWLKAPSWLLLGDWPLQPDTRRMPNDEVSYCTDALGLGLCSKAKLTRRLFVLFFFFLKAPQKWTEWCLLYCLDSAMSFWPGGCLHFGDCSYCCSKIFPFHDELHCF